MQKVGEKKQPMQIILSFSLHLSVGSPADSDVPLIVIVAVGGVIALGIILIMALLCALLCHRRSKRKRGSPAVKQAQDSDLINNESYNEVHHTTHPITLPPQTNNDVSEPATEPEYLSITNVNYSRPHHSDTNSYRGSVQPPENELEYPPIRSEIQHTHHQPALNVRMHHPLGPSGVVIPENEPEYLSITSVNALALLPLSEQGMDMDMNPSYITKTEGVNMTLNGAYWTNQEITESFQRDDQEKTVDQRSSNHLEVMNEDHEDYEDYTYYY